MAGENSNSSTFNPSPQRVQTLSSNSMSSVCALKLNHDNYLIWKNLVHPIIRGNKLEGYLTSAKSSPPEYTERTIEGNTEVEIIVNPEFEDWFAQDQMLLGWLYSSIKTNLASQLMGHSTSKLLWEGIRNFFAVKSRANIIYYKREFVKMQKGNLKMEEYLKTIKEIADNLALAGHPVILEDLTSQVLASLDSSEYNPLICQITEKESVSWVELQSQLLNYERRLEQLNLTTATPNLGRPSPFFSSIKNVRTHQNSPPQPINKGGGRNNSFNRGGRYHQKRSKGRW